MSVSVISALKLKLASQKEHNQNLYKKREELFKQRSELFKNNFLSRLSNRLNVAVSNETIEVYTEQSNYAFVKFMYSEENAYLTGREAISISSFDIDYKGTDVVLNLLKLDVITLFTRLYAQGELNSFVSLTKSLADEVVKGCFNVPQLEREISKLESEQKVRDVENLIKINNKIMVPEHLRIYLTVTNYYEPQVKVLEIVSMTEKTVKVKLNNDNEERVKLDKLKSFLTDYLRMSALTLKEQE